jgi:DNA-binding transcriptional LysR family regulator
MELRHLRYFVAVAEELHFGRAAKRLGMSQPPLSQQIRNLERDLGVELFRRTKRRVQLSPAGHAFLERAHQILAGVAQSSEVARRAARGEFGKLEIAYGPFADLQILPRLLRRFIRRHPMVDVRLHPPGEPSPAEALKSGAVDVALLEMPLKAKAWVVEGLVREPLLLACPQDHPLARQATVRLRDLERAPYVHLARAYAPAYSDLILGFAGEGGVALHIVAEAANVYDCLTFIASDLGVSLLPDSVRNLKRTGVVYRRLATVGPKVQTALVRRSDEPTPVARGLLEAARELLPRR